MTEKTGEDEVGGTWKRANYVGAPEFFNLNQACAVVNKAFEGFGCYLVGSAIERPNFRDVDVRYIMEDEAYEKMFRGSGGWLNPLWSLLCTSISLWLSQQSGLKVDFQVQQQSRANAEHPKGKRQPLGLFVDYPGDRPSETEEPEQPEVPVTGTHRELRFVVNGEVVDVDLPVTDPMRVAMQRALEQSHNSARPLEDWELRYSNGMLVDDSVNVGELRFIVNGEPEELYLTLRAGFGG